MTPEILHILSDGPATTGEVAAELGRTSNSGVGVVLTNLAIKGRVARKAIVKPNTSRGPRMTSLWSLAGDPQ